jgi:valyl-tRNA synthetase
VELPKAYEPAAVEAKWYRVWKSRGYFHADETRPGKTFSMVIPPPNVTGSLHMGHALNNTIQDILARTHRMRGDVTLWIPGTDHAGIATQNVVERQLGAEGTDRRALGREKFVERVWSWKKESGSTITRQLARLGVSCDWERERFTMDEGLSRAVREVFVTLFEEGLVYRDRYLINWCPRCLTALSDLEAEHEETTGNLYFLRYPYAEGGGAIVVATTRPETLLGDTAVAVHPEDERYRDKIGKAVILPALGRKIPIIADPTVSREFGTGAVKITPGHDPNDFLAGKRHGLPMISVMDVEAKMSAEAGPYAGLDRYEARKRLIEDLERQGLLEKVEPHQLAIGHCYRCRTVVEPMLSVQWFVKVGRLAEPAIAAVREGKTRFAPEHWEKVYFGWMENIRDWCISRQLWWGHQIPAWYCEDHDAAEILGKDASGGLIVSERATPIVSRSDPTSCPRCGSKRLVRDSDVLDTWFSSALWPFSTMGWPEKTATLARFYPTSVLVTGFDIIFFWVARMMMMGIHFMKDVPFRDVYVHALVRDEQGQKMSKSKGNVIDPLELLDRYGTDALRFTLVALSAMGRDIKLSEDRVEGYRNFANKIWNAARFVLMNAADAPPVDADLPRPSDDLTLADRWILQRLAATTAEVRESIDAYRFNESASALYRFLWSDYCDWYLEMAKISLAEPARRGITLRVLVGVLERFLRLLHPFMPFLTEELWQALPTQKPTDSIMIAPFPDADGKWQRVEVAAMETVIEATRAVRNVRADLNVAPSTQIDVLVFGDASAFAPHESYVRRLAGVGNIDYRDGTERPKAAATVVVGGMELAIPLRGLIEDPAAEKARIKKQLDKVEKEGRGIAAKLANPQFLERAPAEIIDKEREKQRELAERRATLERNLERLASL